MAQELFGDDLISVVNRIMDDRLRYLYRYIGIVKSVDSEGIIKAYIPEINMPDSPDSWVFALPGTRFKSAIPPKVNDNLEIYFPDGTLTSARYNSQDPSYSSPNGGLKKYVLFELSSQEYVLFDDNSKELKIKNTLGEMLLTSSKFEVQIMGSKITLEVGKFEVDILGLKSTIDMTGISTQGGVSAMGNVSDMTGTLDKVRQDLATLRSEYETLKTAYNVHAHGVVALPVSTTSPTTSPVT
jgi:hypothetical protein